MAMQMYMVAFNGDFSQATSRAVQHAIKKCNGFTLMVMRTGIIAAFDDGMVPFIQSQPDVKLVGGVTLSPNGYAADRLQRIFAENLSKQLEVRPADAS
jgi:hypothetical protein